MARNVQRRSINKGYFLLPVITLTVVEVSSIVGTVTRLDGLGFNSHLGQEIFLVSRMSKVAVGLT